MKLFKKLFGGIKRAQKERVLEFLEKRGEKGVNCYEFTRLRPGIMRYGARVFELRKEGYNIECVRTMNKGQVFSKYILKS